MKAFLLIACLLAGAMAFAAESIQVVVGHQCCAGCANALIAGAKTPEWVDTATVKGTTATITAKAEQAIEFVSLFNAMTLAGFPPKDVAISAPLTLSIAHMCCGPCANSLKKALTGSAVAGLDKQKVIVDMATRTATVQPVDGESMNLVQVIAAMELGGFSATKIVFAVK